MSRSRMLNEAETRAKLIDPEIRTNGCGESLIEREHLFSMELITAS